MQAISNSNKRLFLIFAISTILLALLCAALVVWSSNKGLDVIDESFYILSYRYADDYHSSFSSFHLIVNYFLGGAQLTVVGYRIAYLATLFVQSVIFTQGIIYWIQHREIKINYSKPLVFAIFFSVFFLAALTVFSSSPRTLSYNSLNSFFVYITSGLILYVSCRKIADYKTLLTCMMIGVVLVFSFLNKVSTGTLLLGWHTLLLLALRHQDIKKLLAAALPSLLLGIAVGGVIYFGFIQSLADWTERFPAEMQVMMQTGYGIGFRTMHYLMEILSMVKFVFWPGILYLAGIWLLGVKASFAGRQRALHMGVFGLILLFVWVGNRYSIFENAAFNSYGTVRVLFVCLVSTLLIRYQYFGLQIAYAPKEIPVLIWLLGIPVVAAFGTNNSLLSNILIDITAWFAIGILTLLPFFSTFPPQSEPIPAKAGRMRRPAKLLAIVVSVPLLYLGEQIVQGVIFHPYMSFDSLLEQDSPITIADQHQKIYITKSYRNLIHKLSSILRRDGYQEGDKIIALNDMPGIVYLLGGRSPNTAWYFGFAFERNTHALSLNKKALQGAYLLVNTDFTSVQLRQLQASGLNFPEGYQLLGQVSATYSRISGKNKTIRVYAPTR